MRTITCSLFFASLLLSMGGCPGLDQLGDIILPNDLTRCSGPDPRAVEIEYELVRQDTDTSGRIRVTGTVDNHGRVAFSSSSGQQSVVLYEGDAIVATEDFVNLLIDEEITVTYERDWSLSDEFLPTQYKLMLSYDPDIYIDDNELNDDCNTNNNEVTEDTSGITALFD
jgi:hypothetical protein